MKVTADTAALALIAEDVLATIPAENLALLIHASINDRSDGEATDRARCALSLLATDTTRLAGLNPGEASVIAQATLEVLPASNLENLHGRMVRRLDRRFPSTERAPAYAACRLLRQAAKEAESQCR
jgi:hypothetical protein